MSDFEQELNNLNESLIGQCGRVNDLVQRAVESYFEVDADMAQVVINDDPEIDRVDVEIERRSISLLAMGQTGDHAIRSVLTIVKINNELERIADCGVSIAEVVSEIDSRKAPVPDTFRVMANSVIGMLRDATRALDRSDTKLAERVLAFDDTVDRFKKKIALDAEEKVAQGTLDVGFAFRLQRVTKSLERIADHCTNICEQLIYLETGQIVRHLPEGWSKPLKPEV
jgi:phosphate transport system protein